ncbi:MAG: hypothetical protein AB7E79_02295 [Rhodospirillaceae bacterium]
MSQIETGNRFSLLRAIAIYAVTVLVAWHLYQPADDVIDLMYDRAEFRIKNWRLLDGTLRESGTGLQNMDPKYLVAVDLLRTNAVPHFRNSVGVRLADGGLMHQRVSEMAWPIPYFGQSVFLLRLATETSGCTEIAAVAEVALDRCG